MEYQIAETRNRKMDINDGRTKSRWISKEAALELAIQARKELEEEMQYNDF